MKIYLAVEMWEGKNYDTGVDIWSCGVVFLAMLYGTRYHFIFNIFIFVQLRNKYFYQVTCRQLKLKNVCSPFTKSGIEHVFDPIPHTIRHIIKVARLNITFY